MNPQTLLMAFRVLKGLRSQFKQLQSQVQTQVQQTRTPAAAKTVEPTRRGRTAGARKFWTITGILALLAAVGGGIFYLLRTFVFTTEPPAEHPPRVEEFGGSGAAGTGSRLVYTSTSESGIESSPEEGAVERDEELLGALDEQLQQHRLND